jgi:hypothetical protein
VPRVEVGERPVLEGQPLEPQVEAVADEQFPRLGLTLAVLFRAALQDVLDFVPEAPLPVRGTGVVGVVFRRPCHIPRRVALGEGVVSPVGVEHPDTLAEARGEGARDGFRLLGRGVGDAHVHQ